MRHAFYRKVVFLLTAPLIACGMSTRKPTKALSITGQDNHNQQVSHMVLKQILENSGRFSVDFAVSPEVGKGISGFILDFSPRELMVLDYNGDAWSEKTNHRFSEYVRGGGDVVVYYVADNALMNRPEYSKICALGGQENRDERAGPYVYWSDDKLIEDNPAGVGGSYGKQHEHMSNARNHEYSIMKGLPNKWKHAQDGSYDCMCGPGNIKDCLYMAYLDEEIGGSGREEPSTFTVDYGSARILHTMLGHVGGVVENCPAM